MISTAEEFVRLRNSEARDEYLIAAHSEAPEAVWLDVIENYPEMRYWVAHNKTVPLSILRILADDPDARVRSMVAMKRKLSVDLFEKLAVDPDDGVRQSVAWNAKAPSAALETLAQDPSEFVRERARSRLDAKG